MRVSVAQRRVAFSLTRLRLLPEVCKILSCFNYHLPKASTTSDQSSHLQRLQSASRFYYRLAEGGSSLHHGRTRMASSCGRSDAVGTDRRSLSYRGTTGARLGAGAGAATVVDGR
jgi:hypothetical protein